MKENLSNVKEKGFIETIDTNSISDLDLKKIAEIEKDIWAHGIGEYVKCENCGKIHSKQDIFGHLSKDIYLETVSKIENILCLDKINCPNCNYGTKFIYDENEYIDEIRERYNYSDKSFLTVYRDGNGEIRAFEDGYIDDFDNIYSREFEKYYQQIGKEKILEEIEKIIGGKIPDKILLCCSVGSEQKFSSFYVFYNLLFNFFSNIHNLENTDNILGLYEAVVGLLPHGIYHVSGANRIGIPENELYERILNVSGSFKSDIFVHKNVTHSFVNSLSLPVKEFMKKNKKLMHEVLI